MRRTTQEPAERETMLVARVETLAALRKWHHFTKMDIVSTLRTLLPSHQAA